MTDEDGVMKDIHGGCGPCGYLNIIDLESWPCCDCYFEKGLPHKHVPKEGGE
jgi:hypothetical protein